MPGLKILIVTIPLAFFCFAHGQTHTGSHRLHCLIEKKSTSLRNKLNLYKHYYHIGSYSDSFNCCRGVTVQD